MFLAKVAEVHKDLNCEIVYREHSILKDQVKDEQLLIPVGNASVQNLYKSDLQS